MFFSHPFFQSNGGISQMIFACARKPLPLLLGAHEISIKPQQAIRLLESPHRILQIGVNKRLSAPQPIGIYGTLCVVHDDSLKGK